MAPLGLLQRWSFGPEPVERAREISRTSILSSRAKILAGTVPDAELLLSGSPVLSGDLSGI